MPADVREIPALREWVAALLTYRHDAGESLSGVRLELGRGQEWVRQQLELWQRAVRVADEEVVQAKAELAARRFPNFDGKMPDTTVQERNLRRAVARLDHCEGQVATCRKWLAKLPKLIDEIFTGAGHRLSNFLELDVPAAAAALVRQVEALERYAEARLDFAPTPSPTGPVDRDTKGSAPTTAEERKP
jgi:hypothetical protein